LGLAILQPLQTSVYRTSFDESLSIVTVDATESASLRSLPRSLALDLIAEHGLVLFRGFQADAPTAAEYVSNFGAILRSLEITGNKFIALHGELMYTPFPPDLLCFTCEVAPLGVGGETMLCDGVRLLDRMSPALRRFFDENEIRYRSRWSVEFLRQIFGASDRSALVQALSARPGLLFTPGDDDKWELDMRQNAVIQTRFGAKRAFVNSILVRLLDNRPLPERDYTLTLANGEEFPRSILQELAGLADQNTGFLRWQNGDFAVLDNSRMMHGRRAMAQEQPRRLINMHALLLPDRRSS
jgi:hypothetical protein